MAARGEATAPAAIALAGRITAGLLSMFAAAVATAAEKPFASPQMTEHVSPTSAGSLLQVTFSLMLVLAAVFAAAWVARRFKGMGRFGANVIQIVADAPLGAKERAVLVQVGEQQLLLGVSSGQVNLLHVLPQPVSSSTNADVSFPPADTSAGQGNGRPDFKAILKRSLGL